MNKLNKTSLALDMKPSRANPLQELANLLAPRFKKLGYGLLPASMLLALSGCDTATRTDIDDTTDRANAAMQENLNDVDRLDMRLNEQENNERSFVDGSAADNREEFYDSALARDSRYDRDAKITSGGKKTTPYGTNAMNNTEDYSSQSRAAYERDISTDTVTSDFDRRSTYNEERSTAAGSNILYNNDYVEDSDAETTQVETLGGEADFTRYPENDSNVENEANNVQVEETDTRRSLELGANIKPSHERMTEEEYRASLTGDSASNEMRRAESVRRYGSSPTRTLVIPQYGSELPSESDELEGESLVSSPGLTDNALIDSY